MEQPREKLIRIGASALSDAELLAIFLRTRVKGMSVQVLAQRLIESSGGLAALLQCDLKALCEKPGVGPAKACQLAAVMEMACRFHQTRAMGHAMDNPSIARQWLTSKLGHRRQEVFAALYLNTRHHLISYEELFFGTIDGAAVHPREVARRALELDAAAVIVCHNHPSGVAEPSAQDRAITQRLKDTLALLDVRLLDHFIVAHDNVLSLAERGMI